jgi:hypothetical protein
MWKVVSMLLRLVVAQEFFAVLHVEMKHASPER